MSALEKQAFCFIELCKYTFARDIKRPLYIPLTCLIAFGVLKVHIRIIMPDIS